MSLKEVLAMNPERIIPLQEALETLGENPALEPGKYCMSPKGCVQIVSVKGTEALCLGVNDKQRRFKLWELSRSTQRQFEKEKAEFTEMRG